MYFFFFASRFWIRELLLFFSARKFCNTKVRKYFTRAGRCFEMYILYYSFLVFINEKKTLALLCVIIVGCARRQSIHFFFFFSMSNFRGKHFVWEALKMCVNAAAWCLCLQPDFWGNGKSHRRILQIKMRESSGKWKAFSANFGDKCFLIKMWIFEFRYGEKQLRHYTYIRINYLLIVANDISRNSGDFCLCILRNV